MNQMNQIKFNSKMNMKMDMNNNPMKMKNPILMNNMINNGMNDMMNNGMNNMMNNQMNNMMNNGMNNMMNNMMNMPINNMMDNGMNNMMNMLINNMMNMPKQFENKMMMNEPMSNMIPKKTKKRKIPSILLNNANKKIEKITFQVEKGLKKNEQLLHGENVNNILKNLFLKRKKIIDEKGKQIFLRENEPMEILHYKFDTSETNFYNCEKKSLILGLVFAYKNHFPITVSPDMIWLLILQGYSKFMDKYSELVREKYVNFNGQKTIKIDRMGLFVHSFSEEDWNGIIDECVEQISEYVGEEIISNLQSDFSTTNAVTLLASQTSIMSAMKHYFKYEVPCGGCGISSIILEGSLEDWNKIKSKLKYLSKFALNWWTKHLIPIIDNIIKTKKYYSQNNKINNELIDFWKKMIRIKDKNDIYEPDILNGWIIKFIPDLNGEHPKLYEELHEMSVPDQIISCPLKLVEYNTLNKVIYNCDIASGFFGMTQDKKSLAVKPVIGCAIVVEEKVISPLALEEKDKIIQKFFN